MKWAPIIPLIGGFPLGAFKATGKKPHAIYSYSAFAKNDSHLVNYWPDVPYYHLDKMDIVKREQYDFMVATPPCAGLSMLNTAPKSSEKGSGGCAVQNEWMYQSTTDAIKYFSPKVIVGENAPTLYTKMGSEVVENLYNIAKENNYSLALYKTSTILHGLPQRRERTFYFLFKSDMSPILNFYDRKKIATFENYLKEIPKEASLQTEDGIVNKKLMEEPYYKFLQHRYKQDDVRDIVLQRAHTAHAFILKNDLLDDFEEWAKDNSEKGYRLVTHAKKKFAEGKGVWDGSIHVFRSHMNALIGRALSESIHPFENRSLNIREALHMMGFPSDFELLDSKRNVNHIAQNVPTFTARDMIYETMKFINSELETSNVDLIRINNLKNRVDTKEVFTGATLKDFIQ